MSKHTQEEILNEVDKMYDHLMGAYAIAGSLRDTFSGIGSYEGGLKEYTNLIRGKIYEIRELRMGFKNVIKVQTTLDQI